MEKFGTDGQATCDNKIRHKRWACCITKTAHTHAHAHTHTLRMCTEHIFSTATMLKLTRFIVVFYVYCLSVFLISFVFIAITNKSIGTQGENLKSKHCSYIIVSFLNPLLSYLYVTPINYNYIISDDPGFCVLLCLPQCTRASSHMHGDLKQSVAAFIRSYGQS